MDGTAENPETSGAKAHVYDGVAARLKPGPPTLPLERSLLLLDVLLNDA
jgi:hypothetical protein